MNIKALKETLKTFLRGLYFSLLGTLGTSLYALSTDKNVIDNFINLGGVYVPVGVGIAGALAGLAKLIDRYVHKNENTSLNGITPLDLLER